MSALLLALALAQAPVYDPDDGPILSNPAATSTRPYVYAAFEFAPPTGLGMTAACPQPNWVTYSQAQDSWSRLNGTCAATTVTANYGAAPDDTLTAERLQIPICNSASAYTLVRNTMSIAAGMTCSIWAKALSGTPTFYISGGATGASPRGACTPTTSGWTQCSVTFTTTDSAIDLGVNTYLGSGVATASDVLVWGAWCGYGTPPTTPINTVATAPLGVNPTGAAGEALTFSRTGTAMCTKTSSSGFATTGIANGDLVLIPAAYARVEYVPDGGLGLLVESSRTNSALRSQEFDNSAWTKQGTGVAAPTVTANFGTAPDGTATAERVQFAACPGATESVVLQNTGVGSAISTVYVKGNGTSGSVSICQYGGVSACVSCAFVSATWTRCLSTNTGAGGGYIMVGCQNQSGSYAGASNTGAADVLLWGAQHEAGAYATSYIPTTSTSAARSAERAYFDIGTGGPQGNASVAVTAVAPSSSQPTSSPVLFALNASTADDISGTNSLWAYSAGASGQIRCYYGGAATGVVATVAGATRTWCSAVSGSSLDGSYNGSAMTSAGAPGAAATLRYLNIGGLTADYLWDSIVSGFCLDSSPTKCR